MKSLELLVERIILSSRWLLVVFISASSRRWLSTPFLSRSSF